MGQEGHTPTSVYHALQQQKDAWILTRKLFLSYEHLVIASNPYFDARLELKQEELPALFAARFLLHLPQTITIRKQHMPRVHTTPVVDQDHTKDVLFSLLHRDGLTKVSGRPCEESHLQLKVKKTTWAKGWGSTCGWQHNKRLCYLAVGSELTHKKIQGSNPDNNDMWKKWQFLFFLLWGRSNLLKTKSPADAKSRSDGTHCHQPWSDRMVSWQECQRWWHWMPCHDSLLADASCKDITRDCHVSVNNNNNTTHNTLIYNMLWNTNKFLVALCNIAMVRDSREAAFP